jgi:hypothetical protein
MAPSRRAVAIACIALAVVAPFLSLGGISLDWVAVPTAFVLLPPLTSGTVLETVVYDVSPGASLGTIDSRGPPILPLA